MKGKYKKKRERQQHQEGTPASIPNNQSGAAIAETHPEKALHPQPKEIDMPAFRQWIRNLETTEIAIAGLFVTVIIAVIYFFQLLAMQDTVKKVETQIRLSVRPFVGPDDDGPNPIENSPLHIDESGNVSMGYTIRAKNYSNVPATNVFSVANLVVSDDLNVAYEQRDNACRDEMIGKPDLGWLLFQGRNRVLTGVLHP